MSAKNNNGKMKRWKSALEEYNYQLEYKPGKTNIVADALSRKPKEIEVNSMTVSQHSDESSGENLIPSVEIPINAYKNQLFLNIDSIPSYELQTIFPTYLRHIIKEREYNKENLISILKKYLSPKVTNCIKTPEPVMGKIQEIYPLHFCSYKIRFTQNQVDDVVNEQEQEKIIIETHKRAHRNHKENKAQILEKYYFPSMTKKIKDIVKQCTVCKENKYDRHPIKPEIQESPIPQYPGHIVHIDIYHTEGKHILTAVDKFSKYAQAKIIKSKATEHIKEPLRKLLSIFGIPRELVMDNEKSLNSASITFMLEDQLGIRVYKTPPYKSSVNGQVERFHSTLTEIMRCIKADGIDRPFSILLDKAITEYNYSIHSTTNKKPVETFFGRIVSSDPKKLENVRQDTLTRLKEKQLTDLEPHNKKRTPLIDYKPGDTIYVKIDKRLGTKVTPK